MRLPFGVVALAMLAACTARADPTTPPVTAPTPPTSAPQASIVAPEPEGVVWQRTLGGVDIVGTTPSPNPAELLLIEAAIAELPDQLLAAAGLRTLVRSAEVGAGEFDLGPTVAFARGPDIWILDGAVEDAGTSRLDAARVLAHELAHTAQFASVDAALADGPALRLAEHAVLTLEFAAAAGWERANDGWSLADPAGTTSYGVTDPDEDMADSVAMVVLGRPALLSADRVRWVEQWLGADAASLGRGKPWWPAGSMEITSSSPIYDEAAVAEFAASRVEPLYVELDPDAAAPGDLARQAGMELRRAGFTGSLQPVADERLPRWSGPFVRDDGLIMWVELWDFRESTAFRGDVPRGPVLSYVLLW